MPKGLWRNFHNYKPLFLSLPLLLFPHTVFTFSFYSCSHLRMPPISFYSIPILSNSVLFAVLKAAVYLWPHLQFVPMVQTSTSIFCPTFFLSFNSHLHSIARFHLISPYFSVSRFPSWLLHVAM